MTSKEIELKLSKITENFSREEFIYDFLLAFGISKTTISRLKKGDFNLSEAEGEILYKGKIFFKEGEEGSLLHDIEELADEARILKQNPRFIILTDFKTLVAKDLRAKVNKEFPIEDLSKNYAFFLPLTGAEIYHSTNDNKADRDAAYQLARLYDILIEDNGELYLKKEKDATGSEAQSSASSHNLNIFLSRLLFCFFAEDTGIFETEGMFSDAIANHTKENGADVHIFLTDLFKKLNTKEGDFPAYVANFPYVNGGLFSDEITCPVFSKKSRDILLNCGNLNWDEINPDIFGSMIQAVADPEERSDLGMHYTSVPNILKLIKPLFLDKLYEEFEKNMNNERNLKKLLARLSNIKFFDPACGSGNFLIITYKEIRSLEIKIIKQIIDLIPAGRTTPLQFTSIKISQFYGIEIKDFAHEMAMLSLWLAEHQMNKAFEAELLGYGKSEPILPLKESGHILCGNAARMDWATACPRKEGDEIYVIGNPPYYGKSKQNADQKSDMDFCFKNFTGYKSLDYISIWFYKGSKYIADINAQLAFVSTNSICQGEQVASLWSKILNGQLEISFAQNSFKWTNNAKNNAGVTVIIVGLRNKSAKPKYIFDNNIRKEAKNISPYLIDGSDVIIFGLSKSISNLPVMTSGSKITDDGNLILTSSESAEIISNFQNSTGFIKKFVGAQEFIDGNFREIIYVPKNKVENAYEIPPFVERFEKIKKYRLKSSKSATRNKGLIPHFFDEDKHINSELIIIPRHSSENRNYIPLGFFNDDTIIGDSALVIYNPQPWLFGVLHSKMHMVWVDAVGGKLETRYRYSAKLCYNTFPFPTIDERQKEIISQYVFQVLDERSKFPEKTMAWLYNPDTMPIDLKNAHHELDQAIERIYRLRPFESDAERLELLFKMYDEMVRNDTLWVKDKKVKKKNGK